MWSPHRAEQSTTFLTNREKGTHLPNRKQATSSQNILVGTDGQWMQLLFEAAFLGLGYGSASVCRGRQHDVSFTLSTVLSSLTCTFSGFMLLWSFIALDLDNLDFRFCLRKLNCSTAEGKLHFSFDPRRPRVR